MGTLLVIGVLLWFLFRPRKRTYLIEFREVDR